MHLFFAGDVSDKPPPDARAGKVRCYLSRARRSESEVAELKQRLDSLLAH